MTTRAGASLPSIASGNMQVDFSWAKFIKDLEQTVCKSRQTEWQDVYSPLVNPLGKFINDLDRQFVNAEIGKLSEKRNSREDRHVSSIAAVFDDLKDYLSDSDLSLGPKL